MDRKRQLDRKFVEYYSRSFGFARIILTISIISFCLFSFWFSIPIGTCSDYSAVCCITNCLKSVRSFNF